MYVPNPELARLKGEDWAIDTPKTSGPSRIAGVNDTPNAVIESLMAYGPSAQAAKKAKTSPVSSAPFSVSLVVDAKDWPGVHCLFYTRTSVKCGAIPFYDGWGGRELAGAARDEAALTAAR